jgi:hypothetical protein
MSDATIRIHEQILEESLELFEGMGMALWGASPVDWFARYKAQSRLQFKVYHLNCGFGALIYLMISILENSMLQSYSSPDDSPNTEFGPGRNMPLGNVR